MNVLQLVPTVGPFFKEQTRVLERNNVSCTVVNVPQDSKGDRGVGDYFNFYRSVLGSVLSNTFDIVHANYGLTAPMAIAQPTRPIVISLWGSDVYGTFGRLSKTCARFADEVIVMSGRMAEAVGGDPAVIPHGVNFEWFKPCSQREACTEVGWDYEQNHVLFPWGKDRTVKDYPKAERVVAAARKQLADPIELHAISGVPHERMPIYMNAADVMLMTSKWEGSPNSVREALACDLPVVATDVGDVAEHVSELPVSQVCASENELVDALVNALETTQSPNCREAVRHLSLDRMGADLLEVYSRALTGRERTQTTVEQL